MRVISETEIETVSGGSPASYAFTASMNGLGGTNNVSSSYTPDVENGTGVENIQVSATRPAQSAIDSLTAGYAGVKYTCDPQEGPNVAAVCRPNANYSQNNPPSVVVCTSGKTIDFYGRSPGAASTACKS